MDVDIKEFFPRRLHRKTDNFPGDTRSIESLSKDIEERLKN